MTVKQDFKWKKDWTPLDIKDIFRVYRGLSCPINMSRCKDRLQHLITFLNSGFENQPKKENINCKHE